MCGRYALPIEDVAADMAHQNLQVDEKRDTEKRTSHRYNIAPTEYAPVYYYQAENSRVLRCMRWGMVPKWVRSKDRIPKYATFNARFEKIGESRLWKSVLQQRCVVPVSGYYEWHKKTRQPYYVHRKDGRLLYLAGLYSSGELDGQETWSFSVVTWSAPTCLAWLHDRMPVVLEPGTAAFADWLDTSRRQSWAEVASALSVYEGDALEWYAVDRAVGNTRSDNPGYVRRIRGIGEMIRGLKKESGVKRELENNESDVMEQPKTEDESRGMRNVKRVKRENV